MPLIKPTCPPVFDNSSVTPKLTSLLDEIENGLYKDNYKLILKEKQGLNSPCFSLGLIVLYLITFYLLIIPSSSQRQCPPPKVACYS